MIDTICLDKNYSTTRLLTQGQPGIMNSSGDKFETVLFSPFGKNRQGEGGLRTKSYFKNSFDNKPLISIVTVVFNGEKYLEQTIHSVINQNYDNVEYIIIDGGSTDGTVDIIKKYEDRIDYWVSEKDNGIYDAMNKGIDLLSSEYILFLNAGDTFSSSDVLNDVVDSIEKLDIVPSIIYGGANVYTENGKFITRLKPLNLNKMNLNMFSTRTVCHQAIFIHKNSLIKYRDKYRLKGELNWYYDLIENISNEYIYKTDIIVCDYYLGGTGDKHFKENYLERIAVTKAHNNLFIFISLIPFFLLSLIFRLKTKLNAK